MTTTAIKGSITPFINPKSNRNQNIQIDLFDSSGSQRTNTFYGTLTGFQASSLTATLSSSSNVVGDQNSILTVGVTPTTILAG